ncbi:MULTISPECIES: ADP-forming succinate--CoA ligase subunit beta [Wolbachia]|uniref:ADP-forming succinate--CoA ligase subunit beta n=1 Tax=Wolbachia TaxID=953 RepID=UPI001BA99B07|nr:MULTISPECIES: ADP-forming succinate--CoA ligase subunit beta [unclassified Wolbachia]QUI60066.1 ADP-forming succinate--CoA ligase subunit beta [Wolbachia endosymbiont of Spodoptera picta]URG39813.1 ADP-forming succinate--CoA ligase subunit beta [Wolbachia endosymbiont of Ostrinia furnacalis]URG40832.1 ADP-forming succinate--CoA ligase subunit beta [Wolbachia endosymbiont of Ostrinia scapulalis]
MNIHEYQAKEILHKFNVPVPKGFVATSAEEVETQINQLKSDVFVVKAQIHAGGRGKAGGVKLAKSTKEAQQLVKDMLGITLVTHQTGPSGQQVKRVYIEEGSSIKKEYYLSLVVDPKLSRLVFIFSSEGGMDIEEVAKNSPTKIVNFNIDPATGFTSFDNNKLCNSFNLSSEQIGKVTNIAKNIYDAFITTDASQIEINPLVETNAGDFIALDAKINFDDNALYRHSEIVSLRDYDEEVKEEIEASKHGLSYIKMDGNIGCMVNGAGLAMATMDIIKYYGAEPANFLDVGGGASKETVTEAFKIILSDSNVKGILVNIFGGIMRCDIIANGVVEAAKEIDIKVPLVVRLSGTNFKEGKRILEESGLNIIAADELDEAAQKIVQEVK